MMFIIFFITLYQLHLASLQCPRMLLIVFDCYCLFMDRACISPTHLLHPMAIAPRIPVHFIPPLVAGTASSRLRLCIPPPQVTGQSCHADQSWNSVTICYNHRTQNDNSHGISWYSQSVQTPSQDSSSLASPHACQQLASPHVVKSQRCSAPHRRSWLFG